MTHSLKQATLLIVALSAVTVGCGGGSGNGGIDGGSGNGGTDGGISPGTTSGVTGTKKLPNLTAADRKAICDWTADLYGGYGKIIECGDVGGISVTIYGPASQAECIAEAALVPSTCQATVAQAEACVKTLADCDESNDDAACAEILVCSSTGP
jgi:hypothetical protein